MSANTYMLEKDTPPYLWSGSYTPILKYGGEKFPLINKLRDMLSGEFRIVLRLSEIQSNLYVNGKPCLVRKGKFKPITVYPNVKILKGSDAKVGGSNTYPNISFKEGFCEVEVKTKCFPHLELNKYNMKIEILELERIT